MYLTSTILKNDLLRNVNSKHIFIRAYQRVIITRARTMVELHTTNTMYSRCRQRNSVEYSRELPKIAECAARLPHVQTRVITSGTHLRIHTAELRGLQNNEISRANYTGGEEGLLYIGDRTCKTVAHRLPSVVKLERVEHVF